MNRIVKNALMVTLLISAGVSVCAESTLQSDLSYLANTSLGDAAAVVGKGMIIAAQDLVEAGTDVLTTVLATTPRDVYNFVSHPDTLAVAGITAAGYALYKYVNTESYRCAFCSRKLAWSDVIAYHSEPCCVSCKALDELQQVCNETITVLDETTTELAKLQVALQELSDTTTVS